MHHTPGTVQDKVESQFAPHRANAERLLGFPGVPAVTNADVGPGGSVPLSMGEPTGKEDLWRGLLSAFNDNLAPPQAAAPAPALLPRSSYTPVKRDTLAPYIQFMQTLR